MERRFNEILVSENVSQKFKFMKSVFIKVTRKLFVTLVKTALFCDCF